MVQSLEGSAGRSCQPAGYLRLRVAAAVLASSDVRLVVQHAWRKEVVVIATHPNPVSRPVPSSMVRAALECVGEGEDFEQLWTKRVGDDLLELCCIPFFAYDLALGDGVERRRGTSDVPRAAGAAGVPVSGMRLSMSP